MNRMWKFHIILVQENMIYLLRGLMIDVNYGNIEEEQLDNETISILYEKTA